MRPILLGVILAGAAASASAQQPALYPGQVVRVTAPSAGMTRELHVIEGRQGDTLLLRPDSVYSPSIRLPITSVDRLEYSRTHRHAGIGAAIGFVIMGAVVYVTMEDQVLHSCWLCDGTYHHNTTGDRLLGAALGGLLGVGPGIAVGYLTKTERWIPIPLHTTAVNVTAARNGAVGLGLSVRF